MPTFRYYCMDEVGTIFVGDYVDTPDLQGAVAQCHHLARQHHSDRVRRVEIWEGTALRYQSPVEADRPDGPAPPGQAVSMTGGTRGEELIALAEAMQRLASVIDEPAISQRLTAMAEELLDSLSIDRGAPHPAPVPSVDDDASAR
ncbi:MAG: hypothetical protein WDN25_18375 [Acetobacteraceae bacterium]